MTSASVATATNQEVLSEVLANLFQAIVDEMAWIVVRSAHTTFIKETQDFGAALVTPEGEMFAYPFTSCATSLIGVPMAKVLNEGPVGDRRHSRRQRPVFDIRHGHAPE